MGCSSSDGIDGTRSFRNKLGKTVVEIETPIDWDAPCTREVQEFPMYAGRLKEIDWEQIIEMGQDWKDETFPLTQASILDSNIRQESRHSKWEDFTWKRPEEIYGEGNFVLYENPGPNDIKQGRCGDCYFLASLSALAEYPARIKRIFRTQEVNAAGCYAVQLYINGEKRVVVVDDYFPYDTATSTWAFSQPSRTSDRNNEIWVLIIEKAWAKIFGSYQRIEAGTAGEALYPLTGCPMQQFYHDEITDVDGFWERVVKADKKKMPMCCCTFSAADL